MFFKLNKTLYFSGYKFIQEKVGLENMILTIYKYTFQMSYY